MSLLIHNGNVIWIGGCYWILSVTDTVEYSSPDRTVHAMLLSIQHILGLPHLFKPWHVFLQCCQVVFSSHVHYTVPYMNISEYIAYMTIVSVKLHIVCFLVVGLGLDLLFCLVSSLAPLFVSVLSVVIEWVPIDW